MIKLSAITHVYDGEAQIEQQLSQWLLIPAAIRRQIEFVIVDDCSSRALEVPKVDLNLSLFRVLEDIPWNQPGCRNLAAMMAQAPWLIFFDADNLLEPRGFEILIEHLSQLAADTLYTFGRIESGRPVASHVNTFLVSRDAFFLGGPYDEDFCGHYGYDDIMFRNLWRQHIGKEILLTNISFQQLQFSTMKLDRDQTPNRTRLQSKISEGLRKPQGLIRFQWTLAQRQRQR